MSLIELKYEELSVSALFTQVVVLCMCTAYSRVYKHFLTFICDCYITAEFLLVIEASLDI